MRAAVTVVAAVAFAAGLAGVGVAQPPGGDNPRDRKAPPTKKDDAPDPRRGPGGPGRPEPNDPQLDAWIKTLVEKMNDPHDAIRDSARAALVAVGPPAIPALRELTGGNDAKAFSARRVIQMIEHHATGPRFPGPPGGPLPPGPGPGRAPQPGDEPPLARALGQLDLSDPQRAQITKLVEGYAEKMRAVLEKARDGKIDRAELRDAVGKMSAEATAELRRVLNPDQLRRFDQLTPPGRPLFPTPGQEDAPRPGRPGPGQDDAPRPGRTAPPEVKR
jgi:hypothetical protein